VALPNLLLGNEPASPIRNLPRLLLNDLPANLIADSLDSMLRHHFADPVSGTSLYRHHFADPIGNFFDMLLWYHSANAVSTNLLLRYDSAYPIGYGLEPFFRNVFEFGICAAFLYRNLLANLIVNRLDSLFRHHSTDFVLLNPNFRFQSRNTTLHRFDTLLRNVLDAVDHRFPNFGNPNVSATRHRRR
jgi:hypothetical protein